MDTETTTPITARRRVSRVMQHCTAAAPAFRYSLDSAETEGVLTRAQREFYEQNGYIVIKRLVPEAALARYNERFQQYCTGARPMPDNMTMMRDVELIRARGGGAAQAAMGEDNITKLQHFHMDRELFAYSRLPEVVRYVRAFCGPNVKSVHTMLINKPLDLGKGSSRHPPHQDLWYFPFRPADRIVASWTAMQKITPANGCLFVKPGSHKGALLMHEYPSDGTVNKARRFSRQIERATFHSWGLGPHSCVLLCVHTTGLPRHPRLQHRGARRYSQEAVHGPGRHGVLPPAADPRLRAQPLGCVPQGHLDPLRELWRARRVLPDRNARHDPGFARAGNPRDGALESQRHAA